MWLFSTAGPAVQHGTFLTGADYETTGRQASVNLLGHKERILDLNMTFPCYDVSENSYVTDNFWPIAVGRTVWQVTQYFPKAKTADQRFMPEYGHVLSRDILLEVGRTLEEAQSMLRSGAKAEFSLDDPKILPRQSHYIVQKMLNGQWVEGAS